MNLQTIVGEKVEGGWKPSAQLLAEWRRRPPLSLATVFADEDGKATPAFQAIWRASRPTQLSSTQPIVVPSGDYQGRATDYFLRAMR